VIRAGRQLEDGHVSELGKILERSQVTELSEAAQQYTIESARHIVKAKPEVDEHATIGLQRIAQLVSLAVRTRGFVSDLKHRATVGLTACRKIAVRNWDPAVPPQSR
jgi:hypothetical protein